MSTNGSSGNVEKNKNNIKGPPPPVAPKPSWPRQTSTITTTTVQPTTSTYSQINDENKLINDIQHQNANVTERHPSQKFNRSSSMNQILTNTTQQQEIIPTRNKSLSIPDSRLTFFFYFKKIIYSFFFFT